MYVVHRRLIGKLDFLFVLIELFSLDVTAEALNCKSAFLKGWLVSAKFSRR